VRAQYNRIDQQEQFSLLRKLKFFHEFSHGEIWEVLARQQLAGLRGREEIVKEEMTIASTSSCRDGRVERLARRSVF